MRLKVASKFCKFKKFLNIKVFFHEKGAKMAKVEKDNFF
jgi:hypothetical protein